MKRISFLMVAFLLLGGIVMAQGPRRGQKQMDPKERAERMTDRMVKEYGLNETQKKQLLEVNQAWTEKMTLNARNMQKGDQKGQSVDSSNQKKSSKGTRGQRPQMTKEQREKMWQEMKASREAYDAKLKKIFTKEQYEAYVKKQAERQQPGRRR